MWSSPADGFFSRVGDGPVATGSQPVLTNQHPGGRPSAVSRPCAPHGGGCRGKTREPRGPSQMKQPTRPSDVDPETWRAPPGRRGRGLPSTPTHTQTPEQLQQQAAIKSPKRPPRGSSRRQQHRQSLPENHHSDRVSASHPPLCLKEKSLKTKTLYVDTGHQPPETTQIADISAKVCHSLPFHKETLCLIAQTV